MSPRISSPMHPSAGGEGDLGCGCVWGVEEGGCSACTHCLLWAGLHMVRLTAQGGQGCEGKAQDSGGGPAEETPNPEAGGSQVKRGAGRDPGCGHSMLGVDWGLVTFCFPRSARWLWQPRWRQWWHEQGPRAERQRAHWPD